MSKTRPLESQFVRLMNFLGFLDHEQYRDHGYKNAAGLWRDFFIRLRAMILIWVAIVVVFSLILGLVKIGHSPIMIAVCLLVAVVIVLVLVKWPVSSLESKIVKQGNPIELPKGNATTAPDGLRPFDDAIRDSTRDVLSGGKFAQDCIERISKPEDLVVVYEVTVQFVSVADRLIITLQDVYVNSALRAKLTTQIDALRKAASGGIASISDSRHIANLIQSVTEAIRNLLDLEHPDRGTSTKQ